MNALVLQVIETARKEIGVREVGDNMGRKVNEYQSADTLPGVGYAWCDSFWAWVMLETLGKELCDKVWLRTASCDLTLDWARRRDIDTTTPQAGFAGLCMATRNDATHIFGVTRVTAAGVYTIEGNTNDDGSRNGNGVYARFRKHSSRYLYVNWPRLLPAGAAAAPAGVPQIAVSSPFKDVQTWELWGDSKMADVPMVGGHALVPAWKWAHWFGQSLGWNAKDHIVLLNNREVASQPHMIEGRAWLSVRSLVAATPGLELSVKPGRIQIIKAK